MIPNLVFVLRRRWPILLLVPIFTVLGVVVLTPTRSNITIQYSAKVYVAGDPTRETVVTLEQAAVDIKQVAIAKAAAKELGEKPASPKDFAADLKVKVIPTSLTLQLTAQDPSRTRVQAYTDAFAEAFVVASRSELEGDYQRSLITAQANLNAATDALSTFSVANLAKLIGPTPDPAAVAQQQLLTQRVTDAQNELSGIPAVVAAPYRVAGSDPVVRVAPAKLQLPASRTTRGALALVIGIIGAIALSAFVEKLNPRIDDPKQAEALVGSPVLAQVPIMKGKRRKAIERTDLTLFSGPFAESFRAMRSHLDYRVVADDLQHPPCVMVVSSAPGEGKTTTSAFLALSYAEAGRDVIAVGADFRRPAIHRLFGVSRIPGLSSRLLKDDPESHLDDLVKDIVKHDDVTGVRVVPSGPGTDRVTGLLNDLSAVTAAGRRAGCSVVIDTAPVMVANDAVDFLPSVDWVIVVVRLGRSTERSLRQTMQSLELNHATVVGCVVVGSLESSDSKRYYYSYYKPDQHRTLQPEVQIAAARRQAEQAHGGPGRPPGLDEPLLPPQPGFPEPGGHVGPGPQLAFGEAEAPPDGPTTGRVDGRPPLGNGAATYPSDSSSETSTS